MFDGYKTDQSSPTIHGMKYSSSFMKIGIIGALSSMVLFLAYDIVYVFDMLTYEIIQILNPIFIFLLIPIGVGYVGFFQKYDSNLAFPAIFIFLLQNIVDMLFLLVIYEIRLILYAAIMAVIGLMMLTLHKHVRNRILLFIFVAVMIAKVIVPYLIQLLIMPVFPGFGDLVAILVWLAPYMIFNNAYFVLLILLFVLEIRNGSDYQRSSW